MLYLTKEKNGNFELFLVDISISDSGTGCSSCRCEWNYIAHSPKSTNCKPTSSNPKVSHVLTSEELAGVILACVLFVLIIAATAVIVVLLRLRKKVIRVR